MRSVSFNLFAAGYRTKNYFCETLKNDSKMPISTMELLHDIPLTWVGNVRKQIPPIGVPSLMTANVLCFL